MIGTYVTLWDEQPTPRESYRLANTVVEQAVECLHGRGTAGERMDVADALADAWRAVGESINARKDHE